MKIIAYCEDCRRHHPIEFDPLVPTNEFSDWQVKHAGHVGVGFTWPERTTKPSWVSRICRSWRWVGHRLAGLTIAAGEHLEQFGPPPPAIASFLPNANVKIAYGASSDLTITLASLASSTLAGREGSEVINTSNLYLDLLEAGVVTVGTGPSANTTINITAVGKRNDTDWPDVFDGTDSAETVTNQQIYDQICKPVATIQVVLTTSDVGYAIGPNSVAAAFGGMLPKSWVPFVSQNTGVALNATGGNHKLSITPTYLTVS